MTNEQAFEQWVEWYLAWHLGKGTMRWLPMRTYYEVDGFAHRDTQRIADRLARYVA